MKKCRDCELWKQDDKGMGCLLPITEQTNPKCLLRAVALALVVLQQKQGKYSAEYNEIVKKHFAELEKNDRERTERLREMSPKGGWKGWMSKITNLMGKVEKEVDEGEEWKKS